MAGRILFVSFFLVFEVFLYFLVEGENVFLVNFIVIVLGIYVFVVYYFGSIWRVAQGECRFIEFIYLCFFFVGQKTKKNHDLPSLPFLTLAPGRLSQCSLAKNQALLSLSLR